jgi:hypothetical protein
MDFVAGTIILAGAVTGWAAITRAQFDSVAQADRRIVARNAATQLLEQARARGVEPLLENALAPDAKGWRLARTFEVAGLRPHGTEPVGRLELRPLAVEGQADAASVIEVRAVVRWRAATGYDELEASTAVRKRGG